MSALHKIVIVIFFTVNLNSIKAITNEVKIAKINEISNIIISSKLPDSFGQSHLGIFQSPFVKYMKSEIIDKIEPTSDTRIPELAFLIFNKSYENNQEINKIYQLIFILNDIYYLQSLIETYKQPKIFVDINSFDSEIVTLFEIPNALIEGWYKSDETKDLSNLEKQIDTILTKISQEIQ
jgi:hypothetical protein